ncbi:glycosyltransferase family 4 protein [Jatrophihabitans sp. DSM 45814]
MRIVHVADSFAPDVGGIERQVEALALNQQADGHDVTVITAVHDHAELDLHVARARAGRWLTVAFPWRDYRMVAEVLDGGQIDVVHAHLTVVSPLAIYVVRAASRRGIPVAITVHSLWWKVAMATRLCFVPFGWGRIRATWSGVSTVAAGRVRRTLPRAGEVLIVPNLVDVDWWKPNELDAGIDSHFDAGEVRMILVGRLKKRKHVDEFIDALALVRSRVSVGTRVCVDIVGEGPRHDDLQKQLNRLGLGDWVTLLGHREPADVRTLLHNSDVFIAPSRQESFGIAALEARAAGLPVIGFRGNGLADFIADGVDGVLATDAADLVDILVELVSHPNELKRLRQNAIAIRPTVTPDHAMGAVERLYVRAMAARPQRTPATAL